MSIELCDLIGWHLPLFSSCLYLNMKICFVLFHCIAVEHGITKLPMKEKDC